MAYNIKSLGAGQLASAAAAIYTVPSATQAIVKSIVIVNTGSAAEEITLTHTLTGGAARYLAPVDMILNAGYSFIYDTPLFLEAGDVINGGAQTASTVDYGIFGIEQA